MKKIILISTIAFTALSISYSAIPLSKNLLPGMSGSEVSQLQKFLAQDPEVYPEGLETGYFGNLTHKAVKAFQKKHGIDTMGLVGPKTRSAINKLMQESSSYSANYTPSIPLSKETSDASLFSDNPPATLSATSSEPGTVRVIIKYKNIPGNNDEAYLGTFGSRIKRSHKLLPAISAEIPASYVSQLLKNPNIASVERDIKVRINAASNEEYNNAWGVVKISGDVVHKDGHTGKEVKVAVIDTGIDYRHTDIQYAGGYNFITNSTDAMDDNGHGTHVTGIISALGNGIGVVGTSPDVKIYGLKVLDSSGSGYVSDIIAALEWSIDNGMHITNNSYGTDTYPGTLLEEAFKKAESSGILNIAAAGNSGTCEGDTNTVNYPARFDSVVAVAATDPSNNRACFSSSGPDVELSAPGISVSSTQRGGGYVTFSGTSMASPHVSGVAALIYSAGVKDFNKNGRINDDVRMMLNESTLDLGVSGRDALFGNGLVKADNALNLLKTKMATSTPTDTTATSSVPKTIERNPQESTSKSWYWATSTFPDIVPVPFIENIIPKIPFYGSSSSYSSSSSQWNSGTRR